MCAREVGGVDEVAAAELFSGGAVVVDRGARVRPKVDLVAPERERVMRRVMLMAPWVVLACGALVSRSAGATPVAECVEVAPEAVAHGMSLEVHNRCEFEVRCELTWKVRCEGDAPEAAARPMSLAVRLLSAAKRHLLASGEVCGDKIWEIVDDAWECKEVR